MKKNIIIVILIILAALCVRLSISAINGIKASKAKRAQQAPEVVVDTVKDVDIVREYSAPGRVMAKYRVDILARISGYLQKSYFKEGDFVKTGQTLFLIEPTEYSNASNVANADISNLKAQLVYAEKQLARAKELVAKDYIAKSQYDNILSQRDSLRAQLASAQSRYNDANRNLGYTNVKAPVDGQIGLINVTLGNYVSPSSGALTTINSIDPIYVTFPLESVDYDSLARSDGADNKNRRVELYFSDGSKYKYDGVQDFTDNKVDTSTGTVTMRATFKNPENQLLHGGFVNIKLHANKPIKTPVVPLVAVQENQAGKFVYVVDEQNLPQLVYIKVDGQSGDNWIVKDGLKTGDRIIVDGIQKVMPNAPIRIKEKSENHD
ncbi:MAG: efflux RND transporter periplasmic adaptor subunit [Candidatus Gastranaerophilaceae bacterium]|nr:efflux RND transporter periplasmic adaptor subunit [Candidatus Gastranaerophilaceae bacterium]